MKTQDEILAIVDDELKIIESSISPCAEYCCHEYFKDELFLANEKIKQRILEKA